MINNNTAAFYVCVRFTKNMKKNKSTENVNVPGSTRDVNT